MRFWAALWLFIFGIVVSVSCGAAFGDGSALRRAGGCRRPVALRLGGWLRLAALGFGFGSARALASAAGFGSGGLSLRLGRLRASAGFAGRGPAAPSRPVRLPRWCGCAATGASSARFRARQSRRRAAARLRRSWTFGLWVEARSMNIDLPSSTGVARRRRVP